MSKQIDFSILPDSVLIECFHDWMPEDMQWQPCIKVNLENKGLPYRLALDYWHFNDGSLVFPKGLVIDTVYSDRGAQKIWSKLITLGGSDIMSITERGEKAIHSLEWKRLVAIKPLGVTAEYKEAGEALGMEVIEL